MSYYAKIPRRILVIRLSSIGDILLSSLLIRLLRKRFRKAVIDMMVHERYLPILSGFSKLDHRLEFPPGKRLRERMLKALKQDGYDTVIDLQNSIVSRRITRSTGAYRVFRFNRPRINRWMRIHLPSMRSRLSSPPHVALGYVNCATALNLPDEDLGLEFEVPSKQSVKVLSDMKVHNRSCGLPDDEAPLVISPGGRHFTKRWQLDKWVELLRQAYENGLQSQVIVGDENDLAASEYIVGCLRHPVHSVVGKYDLLESAALIQLGYALVSNDSAPLHLAASVGTPVVAVFGPTVEEFGFAPFRCSGRIVQINDLDCRPCTPHGSNRCPKGHFRCMEEITAEMVFSELESLLQKSAQSAEIGAA